MIQGPGLQLHCLFPSTDHQCQQCRLTTTGDLKCINALTSNICFLFICELLHAGLADSKRLQNSTFDPLSGGNNEEIILMDHTSILLHHHMHVVVTLTFKGPEHRGPEHGS